VNLEISGHSSHHWSHSLLATSTHFQNTSKPSTWKHKG